MSSAAASPRRFCTGARAASWSIISPKRRLRSTPSARFWINRPPSGLLPVLRTSSPRTREKSRSAMLIFGSPPLVLGGGARGGGQRPGWLPPNGYNSPTMATAPESPQNPPESAKKVDVKELISVLKENWKNEMAISRVYHKLAEMEPDENRRRLLTRMAENEETHAKLWEDRLAELGATVDPKEIEREVRREERYARMFGTMASIRRIEREERGHVANYTAQTERLGDARSNEILAGIIPDEEAHANRLKAMADAAASPKSALDTILSTEKW